MKRRDCVRGENIHVPVVALLVFGNKAYLSLAKLGLWLSLAISFYTTKLNLSNDAKHEVILVKYQRGFYYILKIQT